MSRPGTWAWAGVGVVASLLVFGGCASSADGDGDGATDDGAADDDAAGPDGDSMVVVSDEHNYLAESALSIPVVETAADEDLEICWSEVTSDLQCHDFMASSGMKNVALLRLLNTSMDEAEEKLATGQLQMSAVDGYVDYQPAADEECTRLASLSFVGTPIDVEEEYVPDDGHTYLLLFSEQDTPGQGAVTMLFVTPSEASENMQVQAPTGCGLLDFSADLASAVPLQVPANEPWVLDYRGLTRDGLGNSFPVGGVDAAMVAFYEGMSVTELQRQILDLELIATKAYELDLEVRGRADVSLATERDTGEPFAGIDPDADGTWIVALMCTGCQNPAPALLAVLEADSSAEGGQ